ncbi:MAG: heme NO-binding domain-containing protein [Pedobacter sp.]|nr:heme NO-binding domain-containing protein [Pedobacter sp.]
MKGTIIVCLRDMLAEQNGQSPNGWKDMLAASGMDRNRVILLSTDVDDGQTLALFGEAQKRYFKSHEELANAYGHYWSVIYAPKIYTAVYKGVKSARDFLLKMDKVHVQVTETMANARPPRFQYEEKENGDLVVHYISARGLVHLYAGLARGIGTYFGEKLDVKVLENNRVSIQFPAAAGKAA